MFGGKGDVCLFIIEYTSWLSGFHCHREMQWETLFKTSISCGEQPAQGSLPRLPFCTLFFFFFFGIPLWWNFGQLHAFLVWFYGFLQSRDWELCCEWIWRTNVGIKEPLHPSLHLVPEPNSICIIQAKIPEWSPSASVLSSLDFCPFHFAAHLTCSKGFLWPPHSMWLTCTPLCRFFF